MPRATVRLKDIAEKSGYSVSAVSKALLGKDDIGEEAKRHIIAIARDLGYQPNSMARSLRLGRTNLIGVIIPDNSNPYYSLIIKEIENVVMRHGFTIIVANTNDDQKLEAGVLKTFQSLSVDGMIVSPAFLSNYRSSPVPTVFVSRFPYRKSVRRTLLNIEYAAENGFTYIVGDDFQAQKTLTAHLIESFGENVYLMLGPRRSKSTTAIKDSIRLDGYYEAFKEAGRPFVPKRVIWETHTIKGAYDAAGGLCRRVKPPFAVSLYNDRVSMGAFRAIVDGGLSAPDDVGLAGYDGLEFSSYTTPPLTTVHYGENSMGFNAAMQLIGMINARDGKRQIVHTVLQPRLVERESSKPV